MQTGALDYNEEAFEIRELKHLEPSDQNSSTIDLTIRNMTKREPSLPDENPDFSAVRNESQADENQTPNQNHQEDNESENSYIDELNIVKMNEDPVEVCEQILRNLCSAKHWQKIYFGFCKTAFFALTIIFPALFDFKKRDLYLTLLPFLFYIGFGLKLIFQILIKKKKITGFKFCFLKQEKLLLVLGLCFVIQAISSGIFSLVLFFTPISKNIAEFVCLSFCLLIDAYLIYMLIAKIKVKIIAIYFALNLIFTSWLFLAFIQKEKQNSLDFWLLFWPFILFCTIFAGLICFEIVKFAFLWLKQFLGLSKPSQLFNSGFNIGAHFYFGCFAGEIICLGANADQKVRSFYPSLTIGLAFACPILAIGLIFLHRLAIKRLSEEIVQSSEAAEQARKNSKVKIKAEVPIYLRKRKSDSYFQKVKREEIQQAKILTQPQESAKQVIRFPSKTILKKTAKKEKRPSLKLPLENLPLQKTARAGRASFTKNFSAGQQTFRLGYKKQVSLFQGLKHSFRKFIGHDQTDPRPNFSDKNARKEMPDVSKDPFDSQRDPMLQPQENEANTPKNLKAVSFFPSEPAPSEENAEENIRRVQEMLTEKISKRGESSSPRQINEKDCCLICYGNDSEVIIMPCGHSDLCAECAKDVWRANGLCFICQGKIEYLLVVEAIGEDLFRVAYSLCLKK